jgi:hypothetical protein
MSSARITIGGLDVNPRPGEPVAGALLAVESQRIAGVGQTRDGQHAPVTLTVEHSPQPRSRLLYGSWRVISPLAVLGLILSLVALLSARRRCAGQAISPRSSCKSCCPQARCEPCET